MKFTYRRDLIDRESFVTQYLALVLFTIGLARTLGIDDLLAAFAAGLSFSLPLYRVNLHKCAGSAINWDGHFGSRVEEQVFPSVVDLVLNCGCFIYIGAWMPFNMFNAVDLGITLWRLSVLFIAVLILRRIPALLLLYHWVPEISSWREALFSGHFGEWIPIDTACRR